MLRLGLAAAVAMFLGVASVHAEQLKDLSRSAALDETEGRDGVLPLRGGDGVLPLRLRGQALTLATPPSSPARLDTEIVITSATQQSLSDQHGAGLVCQQPEDQVSKHAASGTVTVGAAQYAIKGICYNHESHIMEVVAERKIGAQAIERSFMAGLLPSATPTEFSGRLVINGSSDQAGRYSFDVKKTQPQ